jgi:hypothetical protein
VKGSNCRRIEWPQSYVSGAEIEDEVKQTIHSRSYRSLTFAKSLNLTLTRYVDLLHAAVNMEWKALKRRVPCTKFQMFYFLLDSVCYDVFTIQSVRPSVSFDAIR